MFLEKPQNLDLKRKAQLSNFIEEKAPPVGQLDSASSLNVSPGEGSLLVTEELALEQVLGNGPTVDHHEGAIFSITLLMDRMGYDFFSGAAFASDEHRHIRGGHPANGCINLLHDWTVAQKAFERLPIELLKKLPVLGFQLVDMCRPV